MSILGDYLVTTVAFGQDGLRIEYMEQRYQTEKGGHEQAVFLYDLDEAQVEMIEVIQNAFSELIEGYMTNLPDRNAPDTLPVERSQRAISDLEPHRSNTNRPDSERPPGAQF